MKSLCLLCAIAALLITGCSKPGDETIAESSIAPTYTSELPMARFPGAMLQIEKKGIRKCAVSVDFSKWPNAPEWSRLACGIELLCYDARIEYLGRGTRGDKYRITLYQPYPESMMDTSSVPMVYDKEVEYDGAPLKVFEVDGVAYVLQE